MRMRIDQQEVEAAEGCTVLAAARSLGIRIPTLCEYDACTSTGSCLVCMVQDMQTGRLLPSCVAPVAEGMVIETSNEAVLNSRRTALELLLSEHAGDCQAPCDQGCPARVDAPRMIRQIAGGQPEAALATLRARLALPRVIAHLCHAPCERTCRRARHDGAVAIRALERHAVEAGGAADPPIPVLPVRAQRIAVVGAGPAGLAAAYHLRLAGFACCVFGRAPLAGGTLRNVSASELPQDALNRDLEWLRRLGVEFRLGETAAMESGLEPLRARHDAVILAPGASGSAWMAGLGLRPAHAADRAFNAVLSDGAGVFACGSVVKAQRHVVQALAAGQAAAQAVVAHLGRQPLGPPRFESRLGKLRAGEMAAFLLEASARGPVSPSGADSRFTEAEARTEAERCMHCDCRKQDDCRLRECSDACGASASAFRSPDRLPFERNLEHPDVIYEPGKCIRCGLCVQVTAGAGERLGLTWIGRGYEVRIRVPFDEALSEALSTSAATCVQVCPTAALARRREG